MEVTQGIQNLNNDVPLVADKVRNPLPTIMQANLAGSTLTVTGDNFAPGATVQVNGTAYQATRDSTTQLRATLSSAATVIAADTTVTVYNPEPGGGASNSVLLQGSGGNDGGTLIYLPLLAR
ncbi:MAG: IPT/TIG domain-containing protein [Chloroflexaceae bacterium]